MVQISPRLEVGNFTVVSFPLNENWFGNPVHSGLGLPTIARVELLRGIPAAVGTSAWLVASATVAAGDSAVLKATKVVTKAVVATAGTNYCVGDVLVTNNGTGPQPASFLVEAVNPNNGAVLAVKILNPGIFSVAPSTVTGGNGTSVVLTITTEQTRDSYKNVIATLQFAQLLNFAFADPLDDVELTVHGYDILGRKISEVITAGDGDESVSSVKAFKSVYSITNTGAVDLVTLTVDYSGKFGMPILVKPTTSVSGNQYTASGINYVYTAAVGDTIILGVKTNPATATSGDPLGSYTLGVAADGTTVTVITADLPWNYLNNCGNESTINPSFVFGVTPYSAW